jgi:hypothetical protein
MRVIVTGGAGYIGAHVVRALAAAGHAPIIVDDLRCTTRERVADFTFEPIAVEDTAALTACFARHRPEGVIHLAGFISVGESVRLPDKYWGNNLAAAASLLIACTRHPVEVVLFSSTAAVYGNAEVSPIPERVTLAPTSPYGSSKLAFERLLHASAPAAGFRSAALRYFNAAGADPEGEIGEERRGQRCRPVFLGSQQRLEPIAMAPHVEADQRLGELLRIDPADMKGGIDDGNPEAQGRQLEAGRGEGVELLLADSPNFDPVIRRLSQCDEVLP